MQNTEAQCPNTRTCVRACKWARAHCDDVIRIYNRVTRAEHSPDTDCRGSVFVCMGGASLMHRQLENEALQPRRDRQSPDHTHTVLSARAVTHSPPTGDEEECSGSESSDSCRHRKKARKTMRQKRK